MNKKVYVSKQFDKRFPFRVKAMGFTVSVHSEEEAKRVKKYTEKVIDLIRCVECKE